MKTKYSQGNCDNLCGVYVIYQLGFIVVVGGFLCLVLMFFGISPKEHVATIAIATSIAWGMKQQELVEGAEKQNGKDGKTNKDRSA